MIATYRTRMSVLRQAARTLRYAFGKPEWLRNEVNQCDFYSQFISWSSLCFDIGANVGTKASIFHMLGARVIAVEPVPECATALREQFREKEIDVVEAAVGAASGTMPLFVGDSSTISSLRSDWISTNPVRLAGRQLAGSINVQVVTLDELIDKYGCPSFCKIDVEGYEPQVLAGLSRPIKALAFEWIASIPQNVIECVKLLDALGDYSYNYTLSSPMKLLNDRWLDGVAICEAIANESAKSPDMWGDVVAVLRQS